MTFGQKLKSHRKKKHLTQARLAEMLDAPQKSISRWENDVNYPSVPMLIKLTGILDVSADELLFGKGGIWK